MFAKQRHGLRYSQLFDMATTIEHKDCICGKHDEQKEGQQPNHKSGALGMSTVTAECTVYAYLVAARFASFQQ
jgi:hypothetical protein